MLSSTSKYTLNIVSRVNLVDCTIEHTYLELIVQFAPQDGTLLDDTTFYRQTHGHIDLPHSYSNEYLIFCSSD